MLEVALPISPFIRRGALDCRRVESFADQLAGWIRLWENHRRTLAGAVLIVGVSTTGTLLRSFA